MVIKIIKNTTNKLKERLKLILAFSNYKKLLKRIKVCKKKKILLIGTPTHGNLGDHAIAISELQFINDYKKDAEVFEIVTPLYNLYREFLKKHVTNDDMIIISGGGWMGNLWIHNEIIIRNIVSDFSCKVVIFPQTLYYTADQEGVSVANETRKCFDRHDNLYLAVRDEKSYQNAIQLLGFEKNKNLLFCPDMVLYGVLSNDRAIEKTGKTAILCLRQDVEKLIDLNNIKSLLKSKGYFIKEISTIGKRIIKISCREREVKKLIYQLKEGEFIVTDRLHAMIFGLLASIPCYVFDNRTGKVFGVASYLKKANAPIKTITNYKELEDVSFDLKGEKYQLSEDLKKFFDRLGDLVI